MDSRTLQEVQSEVIAIEAVLIAVFRRIGRADPRMAKLLGDAFDEAETVMSGLAVKHGMEELLHTTTAAMTIIEELRQAVIPQRASAD
ncbi:MAG TPA: hypothetical protein VNS53_06855 [Sphingomicrobium sp.]|jgi:hypothetical protein|nr:hypothetical protein [Sphingomicrobium sp.]